LAPSDYQLLADKYQLQAEDQLEIKKKLMDDLIRYINSVNHDENN
jgi:hypothetical protein